VAKSSASWARASSYFLVRLGDEREAVARTHVLAALLELEVGGGDLEQLARVGHLPGRPARHALHVVGLGVAERGREQLVDVGQLGLLEPAHVGARDKRMVERDEPEPQQDPGQLFVDLRRGPGQAIQQRRHLLQDPPDGAAIR